MSRLARVLILNDYYGAPRVVNGGHGCNIDIGMAEFQPASGASQCPTPTSTPTSSATPTPTPAARPTPAPLRLSVAPHAIAFGRVAMGTSSKPRVLSVLNPRRNPAVPCSMRLSSPSSDFMATTNCPDQLQPGNRCSVEVTFTPSSARKEIDSLLIDGALVVPPTTIELSGTGASYKQ